MRGLRTKLIDTFNESLNLDYDVLLLTETWLNCFISDNEVFCDRYIIYRRDRLTSERGGGVMIAVRSTVPSCRINVPNDTCEDLFVSVTVNNRLFLFGCTYIPPSSPSSVFMDHISNVISLKDILKLLCAPLATSICRELRGLGTVKIVVRLINPPPLKKIRYAITLSSLDCLNLILCGTIIISLPWIWSGVMNICEWTDRRIV